MADETPQAPVPDAPQADAPAAPETTPLDQVPLAEFVARRNKGEQPAEIAPAAEGEEAEETPDEPGKPPQPKSDKKAGFKNRFDQVYRQRSDAIRALEAEKARATQLEQELQQLRKPAEPQKAAEPQIPAEAQAPNLDQYLAAGKTYEDWMDARIEWRAQRVADARIQGERQRAAYEAQQQEAQTQMAGFSERTEAARTKYTDYDQIVVQNDRVLLSPVMQDIARRSPQGPDILYWLGTHETEANQLGELTKHYPPASYPLVEQHLLLLSGQQARSTGAKKAVPVSQAPAPISPVGGGSTTSSVALDQMPLGDFVKRRNAEQLKKRTG